MSNTTEAIFNNINDNNINISYFSNLCYEFSKYHQDPINVLIHIFTSPLGILGLFGLIRKVTNTSSIGVCVSAIYLFALLPDVPNGEFFGTFALLSLIIMLTRRLDLNIFTSIVIVILSYILQDLSHLATGEKTYQSTYSAGGQIDLANPIQWLTLFIEHLYYLLPLVVHIMLPYIPTYPSVHEFLIEPVSLPLLQLHSFMWVIGPLVVFLVGSYCLDTSNGFCFFPGSPYHNRVLKCNIAYPKDKNNGEQVSESRKQDLKKIRDWTLSQNPSETKSSHWWVNDLDDETKAAFNRCAESSEIFKMFRELFDSKHYVVEIVHGMNEVYVTGPSRLSESKNSDQVFYTRHVDGPWGLLPFVSVYRCIVGMDKNLMITTHFPLANYECNACEGDVLAFDFNREVHYITQSTDEIAKQQSDKFRVVLKLHYCMYPKIIAPLGWLMHAINVRYNLAFRALFLKTIYPITLYEHFLAWNVTFSTSAFNWIETFIGQRNIIYVSVAAALWWATGVYDFFFIMTSFVHYLRYITTYYVRRGIDFGSFKRDVLLFKTLALIQLFYHYIFLSTPPISTNLSTYLPNELSANISSSLLSKGLSYLSNYIAPPNYLSILLIVVGYTISALATKALGIDRTYFGAELGLVEPKWITEFPYGYIPHPMIVSQIIALLGFHLSSNFRSKYPYIIPVHLSLYFIHMLQEQFDIYKIYKDEGNSFSVSITKKNE